MSKFRMRQVGQDDKERSIGEVTEGQIDGKDATGTLIGCQPSVSGKPTPLGYQSAIFSTRAEECQIDVEIIDGKQEVSDDSGSSKIDFKDCSGSGPAKVNSESFRDGWARTFQN